MKPTPTRPRRAVAFVGYRVDEGVIVLRLFADGTASELPPRTDLRLHSPDGFEWGYRGSGPTQLALAILVELLGESPGGLDMAQDLYQDFRVAVVGRWPSSSWSITAGEIDEWIETWRGYQLAEAAAAEGGAA
ncbi:MAG: hypothetical protein KF873_02160 [Gemmataceae bacterium]|nr:hypothetical protein [Gemmataceae bacterium]